MIYKELVKVISTKEIAYGIYQTNMYSPKIASISKPGQFINILPTLNWRNVMRRPMSIAGQIDDTISIIYKAIGEGTKIMSNWKSNSEVDIIGPLGNCWRGYNSGLPILIGGGVGIAPILYLNTMLTATKIPHILIMGAIDKKEHFLIHNPNNSIYLATDNGSTGIKGTVVDALMNIYEKNIISKGAKIFACGPPMMMEGIRKYAFENNIECDLALETIMACGIGICQGCSIEKIYNKKNNHSYREQFALACIDGPIFNADKIVSCG